MKIVEIRPDDLELSPDFARSTSARSFADRLRSSIDAIGLTEPLKAVEKPSGGYLVIDGVLRLQAMRTIRLRDPLRFPTVPVYLLDYSKRFEIRFQSDIYQDLLPSQLATLVEHLHRTEGIRKVEIARFIGVSPATLRNYTGLWRLLDRGGLFARIVELMDFGVLPASNPYAWLRLTETGLDRALRTHFSNGQEPDAWVDDVIHDVRLGRSVRYQLKDAETATASLPPECYRVGEDVRAIKRDLGLRRAADRAVLEDLREVRGKLVQVSQNSREPVLRIAAIALSEYVG
ncbi:ParB/RepB/Spo0J family partition protein [Pengzhenrongella frigida]|uniref:ParB-like N-terminal domain-containing protein n=1 Tax=Pengzhenrongella frigida TaxID=1259133 RepID=A0A4Q5MYU0_9MICO|nr:ParB/RepB/Spo0J family partition protein [Cellulomonas sp. HLT2-17]RYV50992.1 hypothetical protein EUA98_10820 [Cellulomonas sp. HLT2-17]